MRKSRATEPLVLDHHNDGPPAIQRIAVLAVDGLIIRDAMVEQVDRPDMDDPNASVAKKSVRMIRGWKRVWTIDRLHKSSPREVTEVHVKAAERLASDHQRRDGVVSGFRPIDGKSDMGPEDIRVAASIRYEDAMEAVGEHGAGVLFRVVILNWPITKLADKMGSTHPRVLGRLVGALERLVEHYDAGKKRKPRVMPLAPAVAAPEPEPGDLPPERTGRWDRKSLPGRGRMETESA